MKVKVGISNRHIHLCENDYKILFGNKEMIKRNDLTQLGEYATKNTVSLKTPKGIIDNVRLLGPLRSYTQVEISRTDSYKLGINPPVRNSGDLDSAANIEIVGEKGSVIKMCCIIATRHIHINDTDENKYGLKDNDVVKVKCKGVKGGIMDNVVVKKNASYVFELHLDTDDANSHGLVNGDMVEIVK